MNYFHQLGYLGPFSLRINPAYGRSDHSTHLRSWRLRHWRLSQMEKKISQVMAISTWNMNRSRPLGREPSIAHPHRTVQNGVTDLGKERLLSVSVRWFHQLVHWPSSSMAIVKNLIANSEDFRPLFQCHRFPLIRNFSAHSLIVGLLVFSCPNAIDLAIRPVVVFALDRQAGRTYTHVGIKVLELHPSIADRNASAAIVLICGRFGIVASLQNARPDHVSRCSGHPMFFRSLIPAPARFAIPVSQTGGQNRHLFAARTSTEPTLHSRNDSNSGPLTEFFSWLNGLVRSARKATCFVSIIWLVHAPYNIERMA